MLLLIYIVAQLNAREGSTGHQRLAEQIKILWCLYSLYTIAAIISPAGIISEREPVYNVLHNEDGKTQENSAYF